MERMLRILVAVALAAGVAYAVLWAVRIAGFGYLLSASQEAPEPVRPDIPFAPLVDTTLVAPVYRWAQGRSLEAVLRGTELAAGDFVRWCKQVIDVLDQISVAAPDQETALAAHEAVGLLRRGVVAYTSV